MHYHCELYMPEDVEDIEAYIAKELEPFREDFSCQTGSHEDGECDCPKRGFWDWYQVGGRWKGVHDPSYDARLDPENADWPTTWKPHCKDMLHVTDIDDELTCFTLILGERVWHQEDKNPNFTDFGGNEPYFIQVWDGNVKKVLKEMGIESGYLITIDYHS